MAGNQLGYIKGKLGLKGQTKPGQMLSRVNALKREALSEGESVKKERGETKKKSSSMKCKSCGMMHKDTSCMKTAPMKYKGAPSNPNSPQNYGPMMQSSYSRMYGTPPNSRGDYARIPRMMAKTKGIKGRKK